MVYYDRFQGNYEDAASKTVKRRNSLIARIKDMDPEDLTDFLGEYSEDGEAERDLEWVEATNPWRPNSPEKILVRPIISITIGRPNATREKDRSDGGAYLLTLEGRLPSGDTRLIGSIGFSHLNGELLREPFLELNMSTDDDRARGPVSWDSADALLFLGLAEEAMAAQPNQTRAI